MNGLLIVGCALLCIAAAQDYCAPGLCPVGVTHIGCNANENFGDACLPDSEMVQMTASLRQNILDAHNLRRNKLSKGLISGYDTAARMPVMQWSGELSYLAELKAKTCTFVHDTCHNTKRFKQTGQNMAYLSDWGKFGEAKPTVDKFMKMWFQEYKTADMGIISSFRFSDDPINTPHSHFTELASDRCNFVGCALSHYTDKWNNNLKTSLLICNYSFTNIFGEAIYDVGPTGSKCSSGMSKVWDGLCSVNEEITPYASGKYGNW